MTKLKTFAAAGISALVVAGAFAAPAMAQDYRYAQRGYEHNYSPASGQLTSGYVDSLEWRINNAAREGQISNRDARRLVADLRQIQGPMIYRVETGRANGWEVRRVQDTVARIEAATRGYAMNDRRDRWGRRY